MPMLPITPATAITYALCIAATTHNEARNQSTQAQRAVICTIINNTNKANDQQTTTPATPCSIATNTKKYTSNRTRNFAGKALVSGAPTSHHAQAIRIPRSDTTSYLKAIRLATYAVENPQTFCTNYPYHYFNNFELGVRYQTGIKPKRIGALLFY